jgi:hypothetical protein
VFARRRSQSHLVAIALAAGALLTAKCSGPTLRSKTIVVPPPTITCPVAPSPVTSSNGQSATVTYGSATVTGGTAPVTVSCTPASGSTFNLGFTDVACTATDAVRRSASCSFAVTVALPSPRLGVTTILAFGDSITEGEVLIAGEFSIRPKFVEPDSVLREAWLPEELVQVDDWEPRDLSPMQHREGEGLTVVQVALVARPRCRADSSVGGRPALRVYAERKAAEDILESPEPWPLLQRTD